MKVDLRMSLQPAISLGLMGVQVVEDDVNLSIAIFGNSIAAILLGGYQCLKRLLDETFRVAILSPE